MTKLPKCPTWLGLFAMCGKSEVKIYLRKWPKELQLAVALALSVAKWSPQRRAAQGVGSCGLCQYHILHNLSCDPCPLARIPDGYCGYPNSFYRLAAAERADGYQHRAAHNALYNTLVELYRIEWEKL